MKALVLVALAAVDAHALRPCEAERHWSLPDGATVPLHPTLVLFTDDASVRPITAPLTVTLDGKPVRFTATLDETTRVETVVVLADKPGQLEITAESYPTARYVLAAAKAPREAHVTSSKKYDDSGYHYGGRGFELATDVQAVAFDVRWRRDAETKWQSERLPAIPKDTQVLVLGSRYCAREIIGDALAIGLDVEVTALLSSGVKVPLRDVPAHLHLPWPKR